MCLTYGVMHASRCQGFCRLASNGRQLLGSAFAAKPLSWAFLSWKQGASPFLVPASLPLQLVLGCGNWVEAITEQGGGGGGPGSAGQGPFGTGAGGTIPALIAASNASNSNFNNGNGNGHGGSSNSSRPGTPAGGGGKRSRMKVAQLSRAAAGRTPQLLPQEFWAVSRRDYDGESLQHLLEFCNNTWVGRGGACRALGKAHDSCLCCLAVLLSLRTQ